MARLITVSAWLKATKGVELHTKIKDEGVFWSIVIRGRAVTEERDDDLGTLQTWFEETIAGDKWAVSPSTTRGITYARMQAAATKLLGREVTDADWPEVVERAKERWIGEVTDANSCSFHDYLGGDQRHLVKVSKDAEQVYLSADCPGGIVGRIGEQRVYARAGYFIKPDLEALRRVVEEAGAFTPADHGDLKENRGDMVDAVVPPEQGDDDDGEIVATACGIARDFLMRDLNAQPAMGKLEDLKNQVGESTPGMKKRIARNLPKEELPLMQFVEQFRVNLRNDGQLPQTNVAKFLAYQLASRKGVLRYNANTGVVSHKA